MTVTLQDEEGKEPRSVNDEADIGKGKIIRQLDSNQEQGKKSSSKRFKVDSIYEGVRWHSEIVFDEEYIAFFT